MRTIARILDEPRQRLSPVAISTIPQTLRVEWTPESGTHVPIRSTWRDPIGPMLTNRRIAQHIREGWYGEGRRRKQLEKDYQRAARTDIVFRCPGCGTDKAVRFIRYSYMPKAGYWCNACREIHRSNAERDAKLTREFKARVEKAVMERYI